MAGARAGLIQVDDELLAMLPGENLVGRLDDRVGQPRLQPAGLLVRERGRRLIQTTASTKAGSGRSPLIGKFSAARSVWTPYRASAGTGFSPRGSRSRRVVVMVAAVLVGGRGMISAREETDNR